MDDAVNIDEERLRREERAYRQERLCRENRCKEAPELGKVLGHDRLAHHIINSLAWAHITKAAQVRALNDEELEGIRGIGANSIARIRIHFRASDE